MKLLILNGPNLNLLGSRQPEVYGHTTLAQIEEGLRETFRELDLVFLQSNHEGELIDAIQAASQQGIHGIVFNPGGYTHTSVALRDAVDGTSIPVVEVHLSNIYGREEFRRRSLLAPVCAGQITGLGVAGYELAIRYLRQTGT
jgi:3-dehydroquinate dehydratase II